MSCRLHSTTEWRGLRGSWRENLGNLTPVPPSFNLIYPWQIIHPVNVWKPSCCCMLSCTRGEPLRVYMTPTPHGASKNNQGCCINMKERLLYDFSFSCKWCSNLSKFAKCFFVFFLLHSEDRYAGIAGTFSIFAKSRKISKDKETLSYMAWFKKEKKNLAPPPNKKKRALLVVGYTVRAWQLYLKLIK